MQKYVSEEWTNSLEENVVDQDEEEKRHAALKFYCIEVDRYEFIAADAVTAMCC